MKKVFSIILLIYIMVSCASINNRKEYFQIYKGHLGEPWQYYLILKYSVQNTYERYYPSFSYSFSGNFSFRNDTLCLYSEEITEVFIVSSKKTLSRSWEDMLGKHYEELKLLY